MLTHLSKLQNKQIAKNIFIGFNDNMNSINTTFNQNISLFSNWVDSTPVPQVIDTVTYDLYESNNPFKWNYNEQRIKNNVLRNTLNATTTVGAEFYSAFTNPYYLTHKIVNIPTNYKNVVNLYEKYSTKSS